MTHNHYTAAVAYSGILLLLLQLLLLLTVCLSTIHCSTISPTILYLPSLCTTLLLGWEDESGEEEDEGPPSCYGRRMRVRRGQDTTIISSSTSHFY